MGIYDLSYQDKVLIAANRIASSYPRGNFGFTINYNGPELIIVPWEEKQDIGKVKLEPIRVRDNYSVGGDKGITSMLEEILEELDEEAYEYAELPD